MLKNIFTVVLVMGFLLIYGEQKETRYDDTDLYETSLSVEEVVYHAKDFNRLSSVLAFLEKKDPYHVVGLWETSTCGSVGKRLDVERKVESNVYWTASPRK